MADGKKGVGFMEKNAIFSWKTDENVLSLQRQKNGSWFMVHGLPFTVYRLPFTV